MLKKAYFVLLIFAVVGCQQNNPQEQLKYINGYWEIKKVERNGEIAKEYGFNSVVEHFEFNKNKGTKKKAKPQLDGTYILFNSAEEIEAKIENDSLRLYYSTNFDQWKETVLEANKDELVIQGRGDLVFYYKKFNGYLNHEKEN